MQEKKALGLWKWLMILLVICNVALIVTIWFKPASNNPRRGIPPVNFSEQLNLSKEQNAQFAQLRKEQRKTIDSLKKLTNDVRIAFFASMKKPSATPAQLDSMATMLGNYHKLIELQTYAHFSKVRAMLTAAQQATYDNVIGDVLKSLPEQPHFKGDGIGPKGPPDDSAAPHDDRNDGPQEGDETPPPPRDGRHHHPGDGFGPPPHDGPPPPPDGPQPPREGNKPPPPPEQ